MSGAAAHVPSTVKTPAQGGPRKNAKEGPLGLPIVWWKRIGIAAAVVAVAVAIGGTVKATKKDDVEKAKSTGKSWKNKAEDKLFK
ncbi:hypothetical protein WJX72_004531 [[Myrmecia] bisecta]|uniref:Uncharacterized protein n=1 Tax=[Myrmecia] bisecta TaxID=41462 RepID=A0AAW1R6C6_9CHLO